MRHVVITVLVACLPALACAQTAPDGSQLSVPLFAAGGKPAGLAEMTDTPNGVVIRATIEPGTLPAGEHAIHFHEVGDCSDVDDGFKKAGGHYDPTAHEHGFIPENGPHAGDLPNFVIVDGEKTEAEFFNPAVRFTEGDAPLFDNDGSALVIHAKADDYKTQPSGDSGDRIACGELTAK